MKLHDLQYVPTATLATSQTVYRVQRSRAHPHAVAVGALRLAPANDLSSRFAVGTASVAYFAESPETAVYESLVRREAVSLSLKIISARALLCLRTTRSLRLLDLRPHTPSWPVLQSLRFEATQGIAKDALAADFDGIVYRSAQQYGQDCLVVLGSAADAFKLAWRKPLVRADGAFHHALVAAIHGGQIMVAP
jgi:hypothetical protein